MVFSAAWGDVDGDGDLDLALGTSYDAPDRVYLNDGKRLQPVAAWESHDTVRTYDLAWGDMDGDGDLDLAVAAEDNPPGVHLNDLLPLQTAAAWMSTSPDSAHSVAWGDWDGDGDLDLAVGNWGGPNRVYHNAGGELALAWSSPEGDDTRSVAWGDVDGDGDLDLAVGNSGPNRVYHNVGGTLTLAWSLTESDNTYSVAWGDWDNDGDLDLAVGNDGQPNMVYPNNEGLLQTSPIWTDIVSERTSSVAWGDLDGDGDLDLAMGNSGPNRVYRNDGGSLALAWSSPEWDHTRSVAWGDVDRDGDLDLAVGNWGPNRVYRNADGMLEESAVWVSGDMDDTYSVAWGDADGDGDLDLAAGNAGGCGGAAIDPDKIYMNVGGALQTAADELWMPDTRLPSRSVAWGDVDGDGDLDLATGTMRTDEYSGYVGGQTRLFLNGRAAPPLNPGYAGWLASGLGSDPVQTFNQMVTTLAPANFYAVPGIRAAGVIPITYTLSHPTADPARGVAAFYSPDGGGRWYAATATTDTITRNLATGHITSTLPNLDLAIPPSSAISSSLSFDRSGPIHDLEVIVQLGHTQPGQLRASLWSPWPSPSGTTVVLFDGVGTSDGDFANVVLGDRYSRSITTTVGSTNTVGAYSPLDPLAGLYGAPLDVPITLFITNTSGVTGTLHMWELKSLGESYVYDWDVLASGFLGQSDNVVVRIEAYDVSCCDALTGTYGFTNSVPGPYYRSHYVTAQTFPFRVRGSQVRVFSGTVPVSNALVYRIPSGQARGEPIVDAAGHPFRTDFQGYLQGRGVIGIGDTLVALLPIATTDGYVLYYTNAPPTPTGLEAHTVTAWGVQALTVSADYPLLLFDLEVSLEWDARNDALFMAQLEYDLQRASALLYDWTDGQAALGSVTIYHDREQWNEADVRIYATNRLRPSAAQGGISSDVISDTDVLTLTYTPGQVHIGAVWNRYGEPTGSLGEDWPRTLAHELGHYALFLDDNYLGLDENRLLVPVTGCTGAMSDPYRADYPYDEFHAAADWLPSCEQTLSHQTTGRSDWQTIETFYAWLSGPPDDAGAGPSTLPLEVTEIEVVEPITSPTTLADPTLYLVDGLGTQVQPGASARAFLFQGERVTDLGRPTVGRVLARGARVGDRLCVYELAEDRLGCAGIAVGDEQLELLHVPDWQPELVISPVTSRTIEITLRNTAASLSLTAQLYPLDGPATAPTSLTETLLGYTGLLTASEPALAGYVHVAVVSPTLPLREVVTDYALGGNPGTQRADRCGFKRNRQAPAMSADGQVILFGEFDFDEGEFFTFQAATVIPGVPTWMSVVGQAYRLMGSASAPDLSGASISFTYLGGEVPAGQEGWIKVYYQSPLSDTWQVLPTRLDTYHNTASAPVWGEGMYVLLTSVEIPLDAAGWNLFSYPVLGAQPVAAALASISGTYSLVYGYEGADASDPWKVYGVGAPAWVNDLEQFKFSRGYWISITRPITLHLSGASVVRAPDRAAFPYLPATYYGTVASGPGFMPAAGMTVTARIDGISCGRGVLRNVFGYGVAYAVDVMADDWEAYAGCGAPGQEVSFQVGSQVMVPAVAWNNNRLWELALRPMHRVWLPFVARASP
jgi:subtilisin-like proprotein convertase family protein